MDEELLVEPALLASGEFGDAKPLGLVDLDRLPRAPLAWRLPPWPIFGIGDRSHPAAAALDGVVEPPVSIDRLVAQVGRHPHAAAVSVQVLRATEPMPVDQALLIESLGYAVLQGSGEHAAWIAARPVVARAPEPGRVVTTRDGATLSIVIDRPAAHNAIDRTMRDALFEAFTVAEMDPDIVRVALRSTGAAFGTGADLGEFGTTRDPATAHAIRGLSLPAHPLSRCATKVDVHVQGACVGSSLEIAAFAGRVTASRAAWFQLPELAMGVLPGAGGCVSVARRIGRQRAALMILSGQRIDAATALRWGLVDAIMDEPPVDPRHADLHRR
ncbi:enoyl-CoA hydratase/isomerase family protein [Sphingomonas ginsenosidivorax]|uniref:Enoyl-CoA hydratase/isomerase family protein n=1 Tax=Sphingomonas ginsenosidivorax TaxID=862135 RepID=A0A5C6UDW0_9SPHN|nr:enoyl-CoA hydratase/isomerase family protein [Sphingomonas ginsenosidivorax]TXC70296.1 enoyl-CoA hydratase/isomerase family protein [Sphingomonas ginsenosidivorax]